VAAYRGAIRLKPGSLTAEPLSVVSVPSMWKTNRALAKASRAIARSHSDRRGIEDGHAYLDQSLAAGAPRQPYVAKVQ
jgi:hypothetical protein